MTGAAGTPFAAVSTEGAEIGRDLNVLIGAASQFIRPDEKPPLFVNVPQLPTHFQGRAELVEELATRLVAGDTLSLSAEGLPGVGKTTLAVALAHHRRLLEHFKDGVLWTGLGKQPDVSGALATWAEALGTDVSHLPTESQRALAVHNAIGQRRLLFVIDDVWHEEVADLMKCGGPSCCHILTTRNQDIAHQFAGEGGTTSVPVLSEDRAFQLLTALAPQTCAADPEAARDLVRAVGGLPLAIELLGGYLAATRQSAFRKSRKKALVEMKDRKRRLELASRRLGTVPGSPQVKLQETIELSLTDLPQLAVQAFYALGAFAPKPEQFSLEAAKAVTEADEETLALLIARNLLEAVDADADADEEWLALHQTLWDVADARMDKATVVRHREHYLALVNKDREDWQTIEAIYGQIKWAWQQLPDDEIVLDFLWALRIYQERRGLWRDKLSWAEQGLVIAKATGNDSDAAALLVNLGWAYSALSDKQQALNYYEQALPHFQLVSDHASEATILNNIGRTYSALGDIQQALNYYQQALPLSQQANDPEGVGTIFNNIGTVYDTLGNKQQALSYYQQALTLFQQTNDQADEASTLNNIGKVYSALGDIQQALNYYQQALPLHQQVGSRRGEATTLNNIGMVYNTLGDTQQALTYYQQALPLYQQVGDRTGESVTRFNTAMLYGEQGRLAEAVEQLRQVVALEAAIQHPDLEQDRATLARYEAMLASQQDGSTDEP